MKLLLKIYVFLIFVVAIIAGLSRNISPSKTGNKYPLTSAIISIQPFDGMAQKDVLYIQKKLQKICPNTEIKATIPLPSSCLNFNKTRYRADSLLKFLNKKTPAGHLIIGLTNKDISTTKNGIVDWGVMGLGYCPGQSCIASTYRLSKTNTLNQLYKVAIHELGHTQGLPHCPEKTCFMRDAKGKNPTDEEIEFCFNCKAFLIKNGWVLQ